MEYLFTKRISDILVKFYGIAGNDIFDKSLLLQYINFKTKSADRGSKARGSFASLYAIYVLVEDYVNKGFTTSGKYKTYEGAIFSKIFARQRQLPFGSKLQNHTLNSRVNSEFEKFFPTQKIQPILRRDERYWINENLLNITFESKTYNIADSVIAIIDEYTKRKMESFDLFIKTSRELEILSPQDSQKTEKFIFDLLAPNVDARLFEIVSYAILKYFYHDQKVYFGFEIDKLQQENLKLYKTGRTNANDGGIDYVMKPLGRFFQVTETLDVRKYFLDIDKLEHYPLTFVIKSTENSETLYKKLEEGAVKQYGIKAVIDSFMRSIEEVINIPTLKERFNSALKQGYLKSILKEIIKQSRIEFNYEEYESESEEV